MKNLAILMSLACLLLAGCNRSTDLVTTSSVGQVELNHQSYAMGSLPIVNGNFKIATAKVHGVPTWKLTPVPAFSFWGSFESWILGGLVLAVFGSIALAFLPLQIPARSSWILIGSGVAIASIGQAALSVGWLVIAILIVGGLWALAEFFIHHKAIVVPMLIGFWLGLKADLKGFVSWLASKFAKKAPPAAPSQTPTQPSK